MNKKSIFDITTVVSIVLVALMGKYLDGVSSVFIFVLLAMAISFIFGEASFSIRVDINMITITTFILGLLILNLEIGLAIFFSIFMGWGIGMLFQISYPLRLEEI